MTAPFDTPNFTKPTDWWVYNNTVTDGWWGHILLIIIFVTSYFGLGKAKPEVALVGSLFLTLVSGLVLFFMKIVPLSDLYVVGILFVISLIANIFSRK